ncbi:hypothetical protein J4457_00140 [Candidatus Woesearchaeota archaeon]|nr:hypothetical protein [Candidatus Woesearchaeota archaeon]
MKTDFFAGLGLGLILLPLYAFLMELESLGNYLIVIFVLIGVGLVVYGYTSRQNSPPERIVKK